MRFNRNPTGRLGLQPRDYARASVGEQAGASCHWKVFGLQGASGRGDERAGAILHYVRLHPARDAGACGSELAFMIARNIWWLECRHCPQSGNWSNRFSPIPAAKVTLFRALDATLTPHGQNACLRSWDAASPSIENRRDQPAAGCGGKPA